MAAGDQLHRLTIIGVSRDRAVMGTVQPHDLSQHVRITGVALGSGGGVPLAVTGRGHRVDREHLIPGCDQRGDPRTAFGLDADLHPSRGLTGLELSPTGRHRRRDQRMQSGNPIQPLRQPALRQAPAGIVHDLDVVMIFSPVIANEQHRLSFLHQLRTPSAAWRRHQRSNGPSAHQKQRGTTSQQRSHLLTTSGRTVCRETSTRVRCGKC
jgi:hypothetical protein